MAGIQPCLRKLGNNLGYYDGKEIRPRHIVEKKIKFYFNTTIISV